MSTEFDDIKKEFDKNVAEVLPFFPGDLGASLGILNHMCGGKPQRHRLQFLLTGCEHVTEMTDGHKWALIRMVLPVKFEGKWMATFPELLKSRINIILAQISK